MNYIKTKITLLSLMLMLHAGTVDAAAVQEQRSLLQRAKDAVAEHPVATGLIGTAAAAGAYELAARKFGLPTILDTVKADLIPGLQEKKVNPLIKDHLLHGIRLCLYTNPLLPLQICDDLFPKRELMQNQRASLETCERTGLVKTVILYPIVEECMCTYGLRKILGNDWARRVAPVCFGALHRQYNVAGMAKCGLSSYLRHRSLQMQPEYKFAPIISHMLYNAIMTSLIYFKLYRAQPN